MNEKIINIDYTLIFNLFNRLPEAKYLDVLSINDGSIKFIVDLVNSGYIPSIYYPETSDKDDRENLAGWLSYYMIDYFRHPVKAYFYLGKIRWPEEEPSFMLKINKGVFNFQGIFPTLDYIEYIKPWNK